MNRWLLAVALVSTALAGPVALHGWAVEEIQIVRQAPAGSARMLPFTTYQKEVAAAMQALPCKWVSMDGRLGPSYGSGRYDFLCKGGDWATVSMFIDKSSAGGVSRVRLLYREWGENTHPNAGEAFIAQQFVEHVMNRFVPANIAGNVMESFWQSRSRDWKGDGVAISFKLDTSRKTQVIRTLEINGTASGVTHSNVVITSQPQPLVTPTDAGLSKAPALQPVAIPLQEPEVVFPQAPLSLPVPQPGGVVMPVDDLKVPANAPAAQITSTLIKATPQELNTAPEPESKKAPAPLPPVSNSLVPSADAVLGGRERAPSNFDAYNRAVELTKDLEKKAMITPPDRVKSVTPEAKAQETATKPAAKPEEAKQVPVGVPRERDPNAGLGLPADTNVVAPTQQQDPRFVPLRPLPQLKFIPKAEPLNNAGEVIKFEDERSGL